MKYGCVILFAALLSACSANTSKPTAKQTDAKVETPDNGVICRTEAPQGSIVRKKVCTTPEEREAKRRQAEFEAEASATR
jgi:hypothetical protein